MRYLKRVPLKVPKLKFFALHSKIQSMTKEKKKERKAILKEKKSEIKEQNYLFATKVSKLMDRKYRYSIRYEEALVEDDGKAYINVDLTKVETPFSLYSYNRRVDPEIYAYIDSAAFYLRASVPVVINFDDGGRYSDELKDKIKKAVIRHYALEFEDRMHEHKRRLLFGFFALLIGLIFLGTTVTLNFLLNDDIRVFLELITILSWVFIWQSVDIFFFAGHERRVDIYNSAQLAVAEVRFGAPEYNKK